MDEPAKLGGLTYFEIGSLIIGAIVGAIFIGTFGAMIVAAISFLAMRTFLRKNQKGIIKKYFYYNFPLVGNYGILKKCWKRFYI
jgi:hypothetical protein